MEVDRVRDCRPLSSIIAAYFWLTRRRRLAHKDFWHLTGFTLATADAVTDTFETRNLSYVATAPAR
jgi:hypothetical protein